MSESSPAIGHNRPPPDAQEEARKVLEVGNRWITERPDILDDEIADKCGQFVARVRQTIKMLDTERDAAVRPLNDAVKVINDQYRPWTKQLNRVLDEIRARLTAYAVKKDVARQEAAAAARAEADRLQAEAEAKRQKAIAEQERARDGDITAGPIDTTGTAVDATRAILASHRAEAAAAKLEKAGVRFGGGDAGRAVPLRTVKTLEITGKTGKQKLDAAVKAVRAMGLTPKIEEAIIQSARNYREATGALPEGVIEIIRKEV
jgi:hypothetical protein